MVPTKYPRGYHSVGGDTLPHQAGSGGRETWYMRRRTLSDGRLPPAVLLSFAASTSFAAMTSSSRLEKYSSDLATAAKTCSDHCQSENSASTPRLVLSNVSPGEADRNRRSTLSLASRTQALLNEPADFIQHLASQCQLLACLKWLGEFQILACIPLRCSMPAKEIADLAGVPELMLFRVVRMTATAGFLQEPRPGHIAHTALSASFVTNLSFLDAAMFLAETVAPTSLQMPTSTQRHGELEASTDSAYSVAFSTSQPFHSARTDRSRLQRQWSSYNRCAGDMDTSVNELLGRLNWRSLGSTCIVDVCARSTEAATALAEMCPELRLIIQVTGSTEEGSPAMGTVEAADSIRSRITVQRRTPAASQTVNDATVYILRISTPSLSLRAQVVAELNAHLAVLRANALATLILAPPLLPEAGSVEPDVEAMARSRDLSRLQLTNECELEVEELTELVNSVCDSRGRLVVVHKLRSRGGATVAVIVKYEPTLMDFMQEF